MPLITQTTDRPLLSNGAIERSIIKNYRKLVWGRFVKAVKDYELISDGDVIAVCISGGKDSLLLAKLFQELKKHGKDNFDLLFLAMDPGYNAENRRQLEFNCAHLEIPVQIFDSDVFEVSEFMTGGDNPCYMCARMRRGALYAKAQALGANKIALGHHFNDVIETNLMNVLWSGNFKTMPPKLLAANFEGMELIRPMYYIREEAIIRWLRHSGMLALDCACTVTQKSIGQTREDIKALIEDLKKANPNVDMSIFRSAQNVNVDMCLGYERHGKKYDFNALYADKTAHRQGQEG